eukprot:scaffold4022_cov122-Isochrysis_galbana.AAC.5
MVQVPLAVAAHRDQPLQLARPQSHSALQSDHMPHGLNGLDALAHAQVPSAYGPADIGREGVPRLLRGEHLRHRPRVPFQPRRSQPVWRLHVPAKEDVLHARRHHRVHRAAKGERMDGQPVVRQLAPTLQAEREVVAELDPPLDNPAVLARREEKRALL